MDSRNLVDQSVSTDYCKLFGAPNCTQCLLTLIVTQFVEISFKCYQESGEIVLGQPIQRELDDPSISSFLDSLNQFSSGLDVSDGLFAPPSTYILQGGGGRGGEYNTPQLGYTLYNDATQYTTGYQGNLTGSVVVPSVGDIQLTTPSQGEDLFNMLMVGQMQSLISFDPPAFASPPPPPPQPPPPQLLSTTLNAPQISRDQVQNPDTLILGGGLTQLTAAPPPPVTTQVTSSLLSFLQNRGEVGPALNTNGLFQESVAIPTITVAPAQESQSTLTDYDGIIQNGDSTTESQNIERRGAQVSPIFDVPLLTSPPVDEFNVDGASVLPPNPQQQTNNQSQVPSRGADGSLSDLSQLIQWESISSSSKIEKAPVPAPEEEKIEEDLEEAKVFLFPILMSSFIVPTQENLLTDSLLTDDEQLQLELDVAPFLEDEKNKYNNSNKDSSELDCDLLGDGSEDCYALQQTTSQNIYFQPPSQESIDDVILQLPSTLPQTQTRPFPPLQEQNLEELIPPQTEISHDHSFPDISIEQSTEYLPAPEFEFESDLIDSRSLQQLLILQQQQSLQQQQQQIMLQMYTREPEIEIDYLQNIDKESNAENQNQIFAPAPQIEIDQNFDYTDLILKDNLDLRDFYDQIPEPEVEIEVQMDEILILDHADHDMTPEVEFERILGDDLDLSNFYVQIPEPELEILNLDHKDHDSAAEPEFEFEVILEDDLELRDFYVQIPEPEVEILNLDHQDHDPAPEPEFEFKLGNFDFPILTGSLEQFELENTQFIPEPELEFEIQNFPILTESLEELDLEKIWMVPEPEPELKIQKYPILTETIEELDFESFQSVPEPEYEVQNFPILGDNFYLAQPQFQNFVPEPEIELNEEDFESEFDYDPDQIFESVISKQPYYTDILSKGFVMNETLETQNNLQAPQPETEVDLSDFPILQSVNPFEFMNLTPEPEIEPRIYVNGGDRQYSAVDGKFEERIPGRDVSFSDQNVRKQVFAPQIEPKPEDQNALVENTPSLLDFDLLASVKGAPVEPESPPPPPPSSSGGLGQGFYTIWVPFLSAAVVCMLIMIIVLVVLRVRAAAAVPPPVAAAPAGEAAGAGRQAALLARAEVYGYNPPV